MEEGIAVLRLSGGVEGEEANRMGGDGEVKAEDAAITIADRSGGGEGGDVGDGWGGTKDDEYATCMAGARYMEEPNTRPESARAWVPPKKVLRIFGDARLRHDNTVKMGLPKPGD